MPEVPGFEVALTGCRDGGNPASFGAALSSTSLAGNNPFPVRRGASPPPIVYWLNIVDVFAIYEVDPIVLLGIAVGIRWEGRDAGEDGMSRDGSSGRGTGRGRCGSGGDGRDSGGGAHGKGRSESHGGHCGDGGGSVNSGVEAGAITAGVKWEEGSCNTKTTPRQ